ncbi:MAG: DUF4124 domain-containing protein [Betaproteobacteria bacterium]|nr:DUF4124 domain-containing protein [Betaproteobacteria bacterium]
MTRSLLALMVALMPLTVSAQAIYKCVDANGSTTYASSRLDKNCKVISSGPENTLPAPKARSGGAASNPSPAGFPRVGEDVQKARDGDRRLILEQELAGEQRNLEQAKKELAEQEATRGGPSDRTAPYRDRVSQHERNIQAIQKELGNLK